MLSIWSDCSSMEKFPSQRDDIITDILIIGGGMAGILCAYYLDCAGVDYVLVEADRVANGITKNTTAKITSQHGLIYQKLIHRFGIERARKYLEANEAAIRDYGSLCEGIDCNFEFLDSYIYSIDNPEKIEKELIALEKLQFRAELSMQLPLPFHTAGAVKFQHQAQFHPLKFLAAITPNLNIYEHTMVKEIKERMIVTNRGKIQANKVIVTTHFPFLNKHGSYFMKMYQERSYVIALENASNVHGMYKDEATNGLSFRNYENLLLVGGGSHRTGKQGGKWGELESFAKQYYPYNRILYHWATQDCMTLDDVPYIGQYSRRTPDYLVASGFNKWGMTSSMVAARILTDFILGIDNPYADVFSPSRSMLRPQLLINLIESTKNLLTFSKKRCPHLGCALKWNPQEHTYDCPCHGSRFTQDGQLIDNPATGDLKKKGDSQ